MISCLKPATIPCGQSPRYFGSHSEAIIYQRLSQFVVGKFYSILNILLTGVSRLLPCRYQQVTYTSLPNVQGDFKDLKILLLRYGLVNKIRYTDITKTFKSITQYAKHLLQNKLIIELCFFKVWHHGDIWCECICTHFRGDCVGCDAVMNHNCLKLLCALSSALLFTMDL